MWHQKGKPVRFGWAQFYTHLKMKDKCEVISELANDTSEGNYNLTLPSNIRESLFSGLFGKTQKQCGAKNRGRNWCDQLMFLRHKSDHIPILEIGPSSQAY